jgi:hypothetical protein
MIRNFTLESYFLTFHGCSTQLCDFANANYSQSQKITRGSCSHAKAQAANRRPRIVVTQG